MKYKYLHSLNLYNLQRKVNKSISMGYKPVGDLVIVYLEKDNSEVVKYIQAMRLKEND